jgi:hypothetical protein
MVVVFFIAAFTPPVPLTPQQKAEKEQKLKLMREWCTEEYGLIGPETCVKRWYESQRQLEEQLR